MLQRKNLRLCLICILLLHATASSSQSLTICIKGIRNDKGVIRLGFYQNEQEFRSDNPFRKETLTKDAIYENPLCVTYSDLKPGTYGIALLDDENENFQMDYKLLIPTEGFGFSGYTPKGLKRPNFDDFKFVFDQQEKSVSIRIKNY